MRLPAQLRRLGTLVYIQDLLRGHVVVLGEPLDVAARKLLEARAQKVTEATQLAGLPDGLADVLVAEAEAAALEGVLVEARRALKPDGLLVLGCASKDRPGSTGGASYYDLMDRLDAHFPAVTMVGQAPFAGATLVEYGVKDPEPLLDGTVVEKGERVEHYLALASTKKVSAGGYSVVQLPVNEVANANVVASVPAKPAAKPAPAPKAAPAPPSDPELAERLRQREKAVEEFKTAALEHKKEMDRVRAELRERDAYVRELEMDARDRDKLRAEASKAGDRAQTAESRERQARLELAQLQGQTLRGGGTLPAAPSAATNGDLAARLHVLEAENAKLKQKEEDARAESWKALKARSDAEAEAASVREDTVRKLKDARKLASVELTRAMEEAMAKSVRLKEELARNEKERKELVAEVTQLRAKAESPAPSGEAAKWMPAADEDALAQERERSAQLGELVRRLEAEAQGLRHSAHAAGAAQSTVAAEAQAERERFDRMLREVELQAKARAELTVRVRQSLKEREREVEALRRELVDRDARLVARDRLGIGSGPGDDEVDRLEAELQEARARLSELRLEMQKRETVADRAAAAAQHERARAERLVAEERRAIADRNEARARLAEVEANAAALAVDNERLAEQLERTREELARAEEEVRERKDRLKQLKRELERADERARGLDQARDQLGAMESALRNEAERMASMEEALRRAAQTEEPR
jgi:hypothetical protein